METLLAEARARLAAQLDNKAQEMEQKQKQGQGQGQAEAEKDEETACPHKSTLEAREMAEPMEVDTGKAMQA